MYSILRLLITLFTYLQNQRERNKPYRASWLSSSVEEFLKCCS